MRQVLRFVRMHRLVLAAGLATIGIALWVMAIVAPLAPVGRRDVNYPDIQLRFVGIVGGGVLVMSGIMVAAAI